MRVTEEQAAAILREPPGPWVAQLRDGLVAMPFQGIAEQIGVWSVSVPLPREQERQLWRVGHPLGPVNLDAGLVLGLPRGQSVEWVMEARPRLVLPPGHERLPEAQRQLRVPLRPSHEFVRKLYTRIRGAVREGEPV